MPGFSFGKTRCYRKPNLGSRKAVHMEMKYLVVNFAFINHAQMHCHDEAVSHNFPVLWFSSYCMSQLVKNFNIIILINCLAWRNKLMVDNTVTWS